MADESLPSQSQGDAIRTVAAHPVLAARWQAWRLPALLTIGLVIAVFVLFGQTSWSVVSIWLRSETFTHGFLILPISAFLIWQRRTTLALCIPKPNWLGIPLLGIIGLGWLVAHAAGVLVVEQLAMMALVPTVVWTLLGWGVVRTILFPLAFLFFAVPMGEELIPPMMDFTADFTVSALQFTGIPVYREGTFFEIPSGRWSVVEGCSGVRYLIASVTLGCLYAYLTFRSIKRRLLFVALSVVVPVIANGLRAYMIVMIAHLSDMRLALGVDHFIYGWVFFGVVMLLLFWLGSFWREDEAPPRPEAGQHAMEFSAGLSTKPFVTVGVVAAILIAMWPALSMVTTTASHPAQVSLAVPAPQNGWALAAVPLSEWQPRYINTDATVNQTYRRGDERVNVYMAYYRTQRQGAELINSQNVLIKQKDKVWRQTADVPHEMILGGQRVEVRLAKMRSNQQDLLVWYWYWVDGRTTTNHYLAKLWDTKAKLLGGKGDAAAIVISTPFTDQGNDADQRLQRFMTAMHTAIEASLEQVSSE